VVDTAIQYALLQQVDILDADTVQEFAATQASYRGI
jgi:hypothetical protein